MPVISGAMTALSFPLPGIAPLAWFALVPMLYAIEGASFRESFRAGFIAGFTGYAAILYWIVIVMTTYGHLPLMVSIPLWLLLAAFLGIFTGLSSSVTSFAEEHGIKSAFMLPVSWVACDYLRTYIFTGFPWAMLGHSQYRLLPVIQISDITGVFGITALIVLANVVFYRIIRALSGASVPYPAKSAVILVLSLAITFWYGFHRLNTKPAEARSVKVALIQGNIDQNSKWSPEYQQATLDIYTSLSREAASREKPDLIVWPESAAPFYFQDNGPPSRQIRDLARATGSYLLFGSPAAEQRNGKIAFLNSAFLLDKDGNTIGRSDKVHLVPFGEYVPLSRFLPFVNKLVQGIGDFTPGTVTKPLKAGETPVGVLVCYEAIFPDIARAHVNSGSRLLVNITNDAWFGRSSAPYQHLSIAAFRAVETRTPLVRAANTGITSIIDYNGHIKGMTQLFHEAVMTGESRLASSDSFYLRYGDLFARACLVTTISVIVFFLARRTKKSPVLEQAGQKQRISY